MNSGTVFVSVAYGFDLLLFSFLWLLGSLDYSKLVPGLYISERTIFEIWLDIWISSMEFRVNFEVDPR